VEFSIPDPTLAVAPAPPADLPYDFFDRAAGALGTSTSGHAWTLRPTGPYDGSLGTIAQVTSDIELNGAGGPVADATLAAGHVQFATIDHGTGDSPPDGWKIGFDPDMPDQDGVGIVFRWQDATHYWHAFWYNHEGTGATVYLERQNGPTFADTSPRISASGVGGIKELRVVAIGEQIDVMVGTEVWLSVSNSSFQDATHHGISFYFTAEGIDWFNLGDP
jgi:hypothetical protein